MRLETACKTSVGLVRASNEDAVLASTRGWVIVADGMGGHAAGEIASAFAVTSTHAGLLMDAPLPRAVAMAHRAIELAVQLRPEWGGMGSTIVAARFREGRYEVAHVGDSRLYGLRGARFERLTRDHASGHHLLAALGHDGGGEPETREGPALPGDTFLLCSDGLTRMVSDDGIREILSTTKSAQEACVRLIEAANAAGGRDNITVAVVRILA